MRRLTVGGSQSPQVVHPIISNSDILPPQLVFSRSGPVHPVFPHVMGGTGHAATSTFAVVLDCTSRSWALTFPAETAMTTAWTAPISSSEIPISLATPR